MYDFWAANLHSIYIKVCHVSECIKIWKKAKQALGTRQPSFPCTVNVICLKCRFRGRPCPYLKLYPTNLTGNISSVTLGVELRLRKNNLEKYWYNLG